MIKKTLIITSIMLANSVLHAEDINFQPRVFAGLMDYEASINADGAFDGDRFDVADGQINGDGVDNTGKSTIEDTFPVLGFGLTASKGRYFVDGYYQQSVSGESDTLNSDQDSAIVDPSNVDIDREDFALSIGMAVTDHISIFGGYKSGETETDQPHTQNGVPSTFKRTVKMDGPFIGAALGFQVGNGLLGFNLAVADLDGSYDAKNINFRDSGDTVVDANLSGDATGVTVGINWKAPINNNWSYAISVDGYKYEFDIEGDAFRTSGGNREFGSVDSELEETAISYRLALQYSW